VTLTGHWHILAGIIATIILRSGSPCGGISTPPPSSSSMTQDPGGGGPHSWRLAHHPHGQIQRAQRR